MLRITSDFVVTCNLVICKIFNQAQVILDLNKIKSALSILDFDYDDDFTKSAKVFRNLIIAHGFQDGNKRTACLCLLIMNKPTCSNKELENIAIDIANGKYTKDIGDLVFRLYNKNLTEDYNKIMNTERLAQILNKIAEKSDDYTTYRSDEVKQEVLDACNELGTFFDDEHLDITNVPDISKEELGKYGVDLYSLSNYVNFENLEDIVNKVFFDDEGYVADIKQTYFDEALELPAREREATGISVVDLIKKAYDSGKFNNLKCVGRDNACTFDIHGPDKERIIAFFDKKDEFNREDHNDSGINSVEFISDKFDIEVFDNFIQVYKIPQNEDIDKTSSAILESTELKRVANWKEFDNGNVLFDYKELTDDEAENAAKEASIKDPTNIYYVKYDDIMEPASNLRWINGISYDYNDYKYIGIRAGKPCVETKEGEMLCLEAAKGHNSKVYEWVSNSSQSSDQFGAELNGSTIDLANNGEKIGKFSLYKFNNAYCLAKRRLADGKWIQVDCFDSEKKARKYALKHIRESAPLKDRIPYNVFVVGDRVKVKANDYTGTVTSVDHYPSTQVTVTYDEPIFTKTGYTISADCYTPAELEFILEESKKVVKEYTDRQIDLYYKDHPENLRDAIYLYSYKGYPIIKSDAGYYMPLKFKYSKSLNSPEEVETFIDKYINESVNGSDYNYYKVEIFDDIGGPESGPIIDKVTTYYKAKSPDEVKEIVREEGHDGCNILSEVSEETYNEYHFGFGESFKSGDKYYGGLPAEPSTSVYADFMSDLDARKKRFIIDNNIKVEKDGNDMIYSGEYNGHTFKYVETTEFFSHWVKSLVIDDKEVNIHKSKFGKWIGYLSGTNRGSLFDVIDILKHMDNAEDNDYIIFKGAVSMEEAFAATAPSISDLKSFFNTSDTLKSQYANFFEWFDEMVKAGRFNTRNLRTESCDKINEAITIDTTEIEDEILNGKRDVISVDEEDYDKYNFISNDNYINLDNLDTDISQGTGNVIRHYYYDVNTDKVYVYTDF